MDQPAIEASSRWRVFTIRRLMLAVVVVASGLGLVAGMGRSLRQVEGVRARVLGRMSLLKGGASPLMPVGQADTLGWDWASFGYAYRHDELLKAPTGKLIAIAVEARSASTGPAGRLEFSAGGRSVAWPVEDLMNGRPIDLEAMFPEAFRRRPIVPPEAPGGNPSAG